MLDRPEDIARKVRLLLDAKLRPEDWAEVRRLAREFADARERGGSLEAVAINLEHLLDLRRLRGHANPDMADPSLQEADEDTHEVMVRMIRAGQRPEVAEPRRPTPAE
ncbi:hypothetical protein [Couchioplanes azureus]|uniref:hypothetical protein n=1 Tax=Couchioplanes caeruleus TaxID=56438 RepID=UPI0016702591|nr:hypothetical protein [Couchioplanes caeruleus]GGQ75557.1 hypothetical protein GCM10010166_51990 [Couchioplanes caeruleus subsp. azureus]